MRNWIGLGFFLLSFVTSCKNSEKILAQVGGFAILAKDAEYSRKIMKVYYPQDERDHGLGRLISAYRDAQILLNNGYPLNGRALEEEEVRLNRSTAMPEKLGQIQGIFGTDYDAYRRVYVLPVLVERVIYYDFFLKNSLIHREKRKVVDDFIAAAKRSPERFSQLARKKAMRYAKFTVSMTEGVKWEGGRQGDRELSKETKKEDPEGVRWIRELIKPVRAGQLLREVIDQNEEWYVVRYLGKSRSRPQTHELEAAFFPKASYAEWRKLEEAKVEVRQF